MHASRSVRSFSPVLVLLAAISLLLAACAPAAPAQPGEPAEPGEAPAMTLEELVAAADAEGQLNVVGPSNLGEEGLQRIVEAMNARYGTNIQATWTGGGQAGPIVAQIITEVTTGGPLTWDLFITNDGQKVKLFTADALEPQPYAELFGVDERIINFNSTAVGFANQLVLPAYNTQLVDEADVPRSWDDVLDPKWQGRLGISTSVHHLVRLSQAWGHEAATEYAEELGALQPRLGPLNETYQRLILGETLLSFTQTNTQIDAGRERGEPVEWAIDVRPAIGTWYMCGANAGGNVHAAALFCAFMAEQEAFDIWGDYMGRQKILDPSTDVGRIYAEGPENVVLLDDDFAVNQLEQREEVYTPILGFR